MAAYSPSIMERIHAVQSKPVVQRCLLMEEILQTTSTKELKPLFPFILQEMFDFERDLNQGWQLDRVFRSNSLELFDRLRRLLSPEGLLMKLVNSLQGDPHATYEFPLKCLPAPSRHMIEEGAIPSFYTNKLQAQNFNVAVLVLNAFELFMFHFAYALVSPTWQARNQGWGDFYEFLYPSLIDDYLVYFLPCDKNSLPSVPLFGGPVMRAPVASISPSRQYGLVPGQHSPPSGSGHSPSSQRSLFKSSFIKAQKLHQQSLPVLDQAETETWRSETFLQVITEFWLNQNSCSGGNDLRAFGGSLQPAAVEKRQIKFSAYYYRDPFRSIFEHFMPTLNQVKIVRLLVKYLHNFANSATSVVTSPYQQTVQSPLDQFKRSVIPHILQKRLYAFLRHAFDRWPLDSCFRMVLETWLSYIQPWRYMDYTKRAQVEHTHSDTDVTKYVDDKWEQFVEDNLLFYTVLTCEFMPRVYRMDLTSPYSAYMVYRVSRILNLPNLPNLILKAEQEMFGSMLRQTDLSGSYLSGHPNHLSAMLPSQMLELEGPNFEYTPFFSEVVKYNVIQMIEQLIQALTTVRTQEGSQVEKKEKSPGFWASLFHSSGLGDGSTSPEMKRLPGHLEQTIHNFCNIFAIARPSTLSQLPANGSLSTSIVNESLYLAESDDDQPECVQTEFGLKLTDLGRRQLMTRQKKFEKFSVGDPDLQPVKNYENTALVRLLFHFCAFLNSYFSSEFTACYYRKDFIGHFARVFLTPPLSLEKQSIRSPVSDRAVSMTRPHQPRISLRFLASYHTLAHLGIAYLMLSLVLGLGPVGFLFSLVLLTVSYGLVVATARYLTAGS